MTAKPAFNHLTIARSIILMSGTLLPLATIHNELGINIHHKLQLERPATLHQTVTYFVATGPSGKHLHGNFEALNTLSYQLEIIGSINRIATIVPQGILVFVPSYNFLLQIRSLHESRKSQITHLKQVFWETKNKEEFGAALRRYRTVNDMSAAKHQNLAPITGGLFIGVCRGKLSEGVDFPHHQARAVAIVGIPYASMSNFFVKAKMIYNSLRKQQDPNSQIQNGRDWYETDAFTAINQAIGRSIRNETDWAAIILLDERYKQNLRLLPNWATQQHWLTNTFEDFATHLTHSMQRMSV